MYFMYLNQQSVNMAESVNQIFKDFFRLNVALKIMNCMMELSVF